MRYCNLNPIHLHSRKPTKYFAIMDSSIFIISLQFPCMCVPRNYLHRNSVEMENKNGLRQWSSDIWMAIIVCTCTICMRFNAGFCVYGGWARTSKQANVHGAHGAQREMHLKICKMKIAGFFELWRTERRNNENKDTTSSNKAKYLFTTR